MLQVMSMRVKQGAPPPPTPVRPKTAGKSINFALHHSLEKLPETSFASQSTYHEQWLPKVSGEESKKDHDRMQNEDVKEPKRKDRKSISSEAASKVDTTMSFHKQDDRTPEHGKYSFQGASTSRSFEMKSKDWAQKENKIDWSDMKRKQDYYLSRQRIASKKYHQRKKEGKGPMGRSRHLFSKEEREIIQAQRRERNDDDDDATAASTEATLAETDDFTKKEVEYLLQLRREKRLLLNRKTLQNFRERQRARRESILHQPSKFVVSTGESLTKIAQGAQKENFSGNKISRIKSIKIRVGNTEYGSIGGLAQGGSSTEKVLEQKGPTEYALEVSYCQEANTIQ